MMAEERLRGLRRTAEPYIVQTVILAGCTVFFIYIAFEKQEWGMLWVAAFVWALFGIYFTQFGAKYKVLWNQDCVIMRAAGGPERRIRFDQITEIRYETASPKELTAQSRPFRRLVIRADRHDPNAFVDVSLRHFRLEDIQGLMDTIRTHRPDLAFPILSGPRK